MSLSLATRRRDKTSTSTIKTKWSSQQHLSQQEYQQQRLHQPVRKQRSFIESSTKAQFTCNTGVGSSRPTLARGVSVGSQDIQRLHSRHILRKHSSISHSSNGTSAKNSKSDDLIRKNITACGQIERPSRTIQAWSSTSSILKSLDKELAHLNGVLDKSKDIRNDIQSTALDRSRNNCNNT